jgi:hypothetical protein
MSYNETYTYLDISYTKEYLEKAGCSVQSIDYVNGDLGTLKGKFMERSPWCSKGVTRRFSINSYDNGVAVTTNDYRGHKLYFTGWT